MRQRTRADNLSVCKKQVDVSFSSVCRPVIDNEFRHNIVKVVSYFENVMTEFTINNRTEAWKTDVNLQMKYESLNSFCILYLRILRRLGQYQK